MCGFNGKLTDTPHDEVNFRYSEYCGFGNTAYLSYNTSKFLNLT